MAAVLGEVIPAVGDFDCIRGDKIRVPDFQQVDNLLIQIIVVIPHPLPLEEDPDVELCGGCQPLGQRVCLQFGRIYEKIVINDGSGRPDFFMNDTLFELDCLLGSFLDRKEL